MGDDKKSYFGQLERDIMDKMTDIWGSVSLSSFRNELHHASKYHDPSSHNYIGTKCVNCPWSDFEKRIIDAQFPEQSI